MSEINIIPKSVLFGNPVKTSPQMSPNGKQMAYLAPYENVLNVCVQYGVGTTKKGHDELFTNLAPLFFKLIIFMIWIN